MAAVGQAGGEDVLPDPCDLDHLHVGRALYGEYRFAADTVYYGKG